MKNRSDEDYDLLIVGAGLVGATLACLLKDLPIRIALLDRSRLDGNKLAFKQKQPAFDPRVSAITMASKKLFTDIGIWEAIEAARCCAYQKMDVWDADGTGSIQFAAADIAQTELGTIVENSIVLSALQDKVESASNVDFISPFTTQSLLSIEADGSKVVELQSAEGGSVRASLIVAADGANSKIRELSDFQTREWDYQHHALVTTVRTEKPHANTALQRFMESGPLAFLPLHQHGEEQGDYYSSIVWSMVPELAEEVINLSDKDFRSRLAHSIESRLGEVQWSDTRLSFPLRQRHAKDYVQENVVLVGDAAHTIHPLAGQGVNLGLLDVKSLADQLALGLGEGRSVADTVLLRRYQRERIGHNLGMMWLMEGFKHLFAEQAPPVRWLRNIGMTGIDNMGFVKNQLARRAMGLDW